MPLSERAVQRDMTDEDVMAAMRELPGYLDITPGDFRQLYHVAWRHARLRLWHSVQAEDIMTRRVVTVSAASPAQEVAEVMARERVSGVPVVDAQGAVVGIITARDFFRRLGMKGNATFMDVMAYCLNRQGCPVVSLRQGLASDIMTAPVVSVGMETVLAKLAATMTARKINRLPVLDAVDGRLAGIVSRSDLITAVTSWEEQ